jgi:hypothetical protein
MNRISSCRSSLPPFIYGEIDIFRHDELKHYFSSKTYLKIEGTIKDYDLHVVPIQESDSTKENRTKQ